jgi:hypothetical protein
VTSILSAQPEPTSDPFMIKIVQPPSDIEGLGDVLLGALGITGVIVVAALVAGVLFAGAMFLFRRYRSSEPQGPVV